MSAYHPDGPHALARPSLTPEDWQLYAEKFFPHLLPTHREAMIRDIFDQALAPTDPRKS